MRGSLLHAVVGVTTIATLSASSPTDLGAQVRCEPLDPTPEETRDWLNSLVVRSTGRTIDQDAVYGLEVALVGVQMDSACATAATLSWDNALRGGLIIVARDETVVVPLPGYPGARQPLAAGNRRVGFTYTAERGTGVRESRFVVYCALHQDLQRFSAIR